MSLSLPPGLRRVLFRANHLPFWHTERTVWGSRLAVLSADRLLYVTLHQLGLMGADDRRFYEAELRPGMTVLDIGANIGLCTQLFARLVGPSGKVHAFEPTPEHRRAIQMACLKNGATNVEVHPYGLGAANEERWLSRSLFNSGDHRVQAADAGPAAGDPARIELRRGDDVLPAPATADFIKIDVQGWELHVLTGLRDLIDRSPRLHIHLEFWPGGLRGAGTEPSALLGFLQERGLTILRPLPGDGWTPAASLAAVEESLGRKQFINLRALKGH